MGRKTTLKNWLVISILLVVILPGSLWATGTYDDGDGSPGNPFQINTPAQMDEIGQHSEDWGLCFILTADIGLSGYTGTDFHIIGNSSTKFTGSFDGNGHTISNFSYTSTGTNYIGLFGYVGSGGEIRDMGLVDPNVAAGSGNFVGGLVGYNDGMVSNCYATGAVSEGIFVGGLVGANWGTVSNSYATGDVTGTGNVGGLVGYNYGTVSNSYAAGAVSGTSNVGGFTGCDFSGSYTSCFWNSDIGPAQGIGNTTDPNVMSRTTAQMQTQSTFTDYGWDFVSESTNGTDNYWRLCVDGIKYPKLACQSITGDLACPAGVDLVDFSFFAGRWLEIGCDTSNDCGRADMDFSTDVGGTDLLILTDNWLADWGWGSISVQEYIDKMKGGWVGQMAGVGWGGPTEFQYQGSIMPEGFVPVWESWMINQFWQDDIYVEMTFLRSLELYGLGVPMSQAGSDFANSGYDLWHANLAGRTNLRSGVMPGDSGHPAYNGHADDIDYQIEADYSGLISPGLPNVVIELGEKFGRLMNYGDGLYGGQFIGGMYAEAFFETDMETIVRAGLECIPVGSQYHECISDVLTWYGANPNWEDTWQLVENKYNDNPDYRRFSCYTGGGFNIDAKLNGAYIVMGLLYGNGDPDDTITISMRCGQDSDCNPSNAGGILFTSMGYSNVPSRFKSALNEETYFWYTDYNFPLLMGVCEDLARQVVLQAGGSIGEEIFAVPVLSPVPSELLQSWDPDSPINPVHIVITSPSNGDSFEEGEVITITADAWDNYGSIIKVEFFDGVSKIGEDTTEPYSFGWMAVSVGQHSLKAMATDNNGKTKTSTVNITVIAPIPPPVPGEWRSFDVVMNPAGSPQATVADGADVTADIKFYESDNDNGVNMGSLFDTYTDGPHEQGFNHAEYIWGYTTGLYTYPYAAKSTVRRGFDSGEGNAPTPLGSFDLQLHPPINDHLTVAAFIVPTSGNYSVSNLAVRCVLSSGETATLRVFNPSPSEIASLQATNNRDWVTDAGTYDLGSLTAGDNIYFAVDNDGDYGWDDATEIIWTIEKTGP